MKKVLIVIVAFVFVGCTHNPKSLVPPVVVVPVCDTSHLSYAKDIKPIFKNDCYSCHGDSVTSTGGLNLELFSSLKSYLNNGFRGDGLYGSKLYHCLLHSSGAQQMPPTYILDTCSLHKIKAWIDAGGPEN